RSTSGLHDEIGFGGKELLGLCDTAQSVAAYRNQAAARLWAECCGEARREEHVLLDRPAHRQDPADLVHGRTDYREIDTILAPDVTVEDVADMQREIDRGRRQTDFGAASAELDGVLAHPCGG